MKEQEILNYIETLRKEESVKNLKADKIADFYSFCFTLKEGAYRLPNEATAVHIAAHDEKGFAIAFCIEIEK